MHVSTQGFLKHIRQKDKSVFFLGGGFAWLLSSICIAEKQLQSFQISWIKQS